MNIKDASASSSSAMLANDTAIGKKVTAQEAGTTRGPAYVFPPEAKETDRNPAYVFPPEAQVTPIRDHAVRDSARVLPLRDALIKETSSGS